MSTHCNTPSKRKRPDVALRLQRKRTIQETSVKMTLSALCQNKCLQAEINTCVEGVTRASVEASRFLNLYVLTCLEQGVSIPEMDQTFFRRAFMAMAGATTEASLKIFGAVLEPYNAMRPPDMTRFDTALVGELLNYAGREYMTACRNHVVLNIWARVAKAFKLFMKTLQQQFRATDMNKIRGYFMRRLNLVASEREETAMWDSLTKRATLQTQDAVKAYLDANLEKYADLPLDVKGPHPVNRVEKRWWAYLRWCHDLQVYTQEQGGRTFSILPICSYTAKHITIDTGILHGLLKRLARNYATAKPESLPLFRIMRKSHWESHFALKKAEGSSKTKQFEYILKTDGYAVIVLCSKRIVEKVGHLEQGIDLCGKRVVAADPGRKDLVACVTTNENGDTIFRHYSNAEYREKIESTRASRKRAMWLKKADLEIANQLPSAKVYSTTEMKAHLTELFKVLDKLLDHNMAWRVRGLRFTQYGLKQKVMHDICQRITKCGSDPSDARPVVVAFGAGMFSSTSKGHSPGPVKGVRKALKQRGVELYDVQEDYSSQLCSSCYMKMEPMFGEGGESPIHTVRRCVTANCKRTVWNRDVNASLNILHIFLHESQHGIRPEVFTRVYQKVLPVLMICPPTALEKRVIGK